MNAHSPSTSLPQSVLLASMAIFLTVQPSIAVGQAETLKPRLRFVPKAAYTLESVFPTSDLAVSADGHWLAIAREDGRIELRSSEGNKVHQIAAGHVGGVYRVRFSKDGQRLASVGHDGTLRVWSLPAMVAAHTRRVSDKPLLDVAFISADRIAVGGYDGTVRVCDIADGSDRASHDLGATVRGIEISPDGASLAVASDGNSVSILSLEDLRLITALKHDSDVGCLAFTPDSQLLFSGGADGVLSCWRVQERKRFYRHQTDSSITRLAVSHDGDLVVSGANDGSVVSYVVATGEMLATHSELRNLSGIRTAGLALGPANKAMWVCSRKAVVRFDADRPKQAPTRRFSSKHRVWGLAVLRKDSEDLSVAFGGKRGLLSLAAVSVSATRELQPHSVSIDRLAASRDGAFLAAAGWKSGELGLWPMNGGDRIRFNTENPLRAIAFSANGTNVAGLGQTGILSEWKVGEPKAEPRTIQAHATTGNWVSYRKDGKVLATSAGVWQSDEPGEVKLWNAKDLKVVRTLKFATTWAQCSEFAPDGPLLAIALGNRQVRIHDSERNMDVAKFMHTDAVRTLAWSHDGRFLAVGTFNGVVTVWSIESQKRVAELGGLNDVFAVQFAPGNHSVFAAGGGREWVVWNISTATGTSPPKWLQDKADMRSQ